MALKHICLNRLSIGALPTSYWESLSYEEQILWIQKQINDKIIPMVNEIAEKVDSIDIDFDKINKELEALNTELSNVNIELAKKADIDFVNSEIHTLDNELKQLIGSNYNTLKNYVDLKDEDLQYQIDHFEVANIKVYDPTTGLTSPLEIVLNNIYTQTRSGAISAGEYDALQLTASEYDSKALTAFNYDQNGKTLLTQ